MFTKPLHYLGFDNTFVSFCPGMCLVLVEKRIYVFTALVVVCGLKNFAL